MPAAERSTVTQKNENIRDPIDSSTTERVVVTVPKEVNKLFKKTVPSFLPFFFLCFL